jgi:amino acid transporter
MSKVFARYATDAFGLSGILLLLFAAINFTASKGAFDALNYSVQLLFLTIFRPRYRENNFPKTYFDYKVKMDAKERKPLNVLWLSGAIYLIVGIVFLIIYNASI